MSSALVPSTIFLACAALAAQSPSVDGLERKVTYVQTVTCDSQSGRGHLEGVEVRVALPQSLDRQDVRDLTLDPKADEVVTDAHGNRVAVFRRPRLEAGETFRVTWTCRASLRKTAHVVDRGKLGKVADVPAKIQKRYLVPGRKYGLDHWSIRRAARKAAHGAKDPLDLVFRCNEYVRDRLTYRNDGRWEDAPDVHRNRHGSCSEYNFLFSALCRLNGIPTRYVGATALRGDGATYEDTIHHRWTEVWLPGHGWYPVDTSRNDGEDGNQVNRYFGKVADGLLVLMKGDGGDDMPLRWGYVTSVSSRSRGDARLSQRKRFVWQRETPDRQGTAPASGSR